jgi:hypothetical protein
MDILPSADICHNIEDAPWPIESESVYAINASHILEHIKPWKIIEVMNEAWRVLAFGGGMDVSVPFGLAYKIDPTHCIEWSMPAFWYFDSSQDYYKIYKPKPWKIIYDDVNKSTQTIRVILQKEIENGIPQHTA